MGYTFVSMILFFQNVLTFFSILKIMFLDENEIEYLPTEIGNMESLELLLFCKNKWISGTVLLNGKLPPLQQYTDIVDFL